uniref:Uncharacterized protein n=1 Tax=Arundo donax TaxID=35708 RepID=A0A0A8XSJ2_ARUDO
MPTARARAKARGRQS